MRIGLDTILVVRKTKLSATEYDSINAILTNTTTPIRFNVLTIDSISDVNTTLNLIYRSLLSTCWQDYPLCLALLFTFELQYTQVSVISEGLSLMSSLALTKILYITSLSEILSFTASYPSPQVHPIDSESLLPYLSNAIRERVLVMLANRQSSTDDHKLVIIGWNEFEAMLALEIGFDLSVYDLGFRAPNPPLMHEAYADELSIIKDKGAYAPPDPIKLRFLHSLMWSYARSNLLYVGAAPGATLTTAVLGPRRLKLLGGEAILIDPKFKAKEFKKGATALVNSGFKVVGSKYDYDIDQNNFKQIHESPSHLCINDDAYSSTRTQWDFTLLKLKYYYDLITTRRERNAETVVLLKFQPNKMQLSELEIKFFKDVIFQPGTNDSTEVRILLTSNGITQRVTRSAILNSLLIWRALAIREQMHIASHYFKHVIIAANALDLQPNVNVIATYALTSASPTGHSGILAWRNIIDSYHKSKKYSMLMVLPNNVLTDHDGDLIRTEWGARVYNDISVSRGTLWRLNCYSFNPIPILPNFGHAYTYDISKCFSLSTDLKHLPMCMMTGAILDKFLPQSAFSSPGPLIKCFTLNLRLQKVLPNNYTYQTRLRLLRKLTNLDVLDARIIASSDHTFKSNSDQRLVVTAGPLFGKSIMIGKGELVSVSGHLLNIMLSVHFGLDITKLWLSQWRAQNLAANGDTDIIGKLMTYKRQGVLFDYNPEGVVGVLDTWHTKIDLFLAFVIMNDYVATFELPQFSPDDILSLAIHAGVIDH